MTPDDFARVSLSLRWEFRRHHFSERERLVLDWLLDCSLVCGRDEMRAPTLDSIGELAHMAAMVVSLCAEIKTLRHELSLKLDNPEYVMRDVVRGRARRSRP